MDEQLLDETDMRNEFSIARFSGRARVFSTEIIGILMTKTSNQHLSMLYDLDKNRTHIGTDQHRAKRTGELRHREFEISELPLSQ